MSSDSDEDLPLAQHAASLRGEGYAAEPARSGRNSRPRPGSMRDASIEEDDEDEDDDHANSENSPSSDSDDDRPLAERVQKTKPAPAAKSGVH
jgi:hypothetical protein